MLEMIVSALLNIGRLRSARIELTCAISIHFLNHFQEIYIYRYILHPTQLAFPSEVT